MIHPSRREFLRNTATAALGAGLVTTTPRARAAATRAQSVSPNERIATGLVGCGGMGLGDLADHLRIPEVDCLAVCDVDESHAQQAADLVERERGHRPEVTGDFRRLIDRKEIDAVIVATPDHWHALPTIYACQAGKDVYVEKPLATSIEEGRAMVKAARRHDRVVQMGTQQRSAVHFHDAVEYVKSGKLGKVRLVRVWAYLDWVGELAPVADSAPPPGVDYDFWLGPAPKRPFNERRFHFTFRWFWDYSGGLMTDWGAHMLDVAQWAMGSGGENAPKSVMSVGGKYGYPSDAMETPDTQQAIFEYPDYSVIWEHALGVGRGPQDREHGVMFHGNDAILIVDREGWEVLSETDNTRGVGRTYKALGLPRRNDSSDYHFEHVKNFIDCVKSREKPHSDVEIGHHSVIPLHLANIAVRLNTQVHWDAAAERIIGKPEAQRLVGREYRTPWSLPVG
ncbi:MAG: Gfo/Idh/MocA family oxidoreductase [Planctomycetota bacterium]